MYFEYYYKLYCYIYALVKKQYNFCTNIYLSLNHFCTPLCGWIFTDYKTCFSKNVQEVTQLKISILILIQKFYKNHNFGV